MRNPKNAPKAVPNDRKSISANPKVFYRSSPENLEREATTLGQKDFSENTLRWGDKNDFPLLLAKYVQDSPAASACIETKAKFIKGAGFSDPDLMKIVVNKNGQTLWDLHSILSDTLAMFEGFAVNLKFSSEKTITNVFNMAIENARFVKPDDDLATNITSIKYNPYFGTADFQKKYTKEYALYDPSALDDQLSKGKNFTGQVYYYGKTKPLYRFYPVPTYWSAKKWIYVDGKIQEFHAENLENGFFSSVIMQMIGDPSKMSNNPKYMREEKQADGSIKKIPTKTVGEEFSDMMGDSFSGTKKAGAALVLWANNKDSAAKIDAFPSTTNADMFVALQDLTTKNITIATRVPGILANISEGVSIGGDGNEIEAAIELMQSNTVDDRNRLAQFYNEVLLPNLVVGNQKIKKGSIVEIVNYNPVTTKIELDDKFWNVLDDKEKRDFVRRNISAVQLREEDPQTDATGQDLPPGELQLNSILLNLTGRQQQQLMRVVREFGKGTLSQQLATIQLQSFGLSDNQIVEVLGLDEPIQTTQDQPPLKAMK